MLKASAFFVTPLGISVSQLYKMSTSLINVSILNSLGFLGAFSNCIKLIKSDIEDLDLAMFKALILFSDCLTLCWAIAIATSSFFCPEGGIISGSFIILSNNSLMLTDIWLSY